MTITLNPQIETRLTDTAQQMGLDPAALIEQIFEERFPIGEEKAAPKLTARNKASIALMQEWLAEAPTDPEGIHQAQAELDELMENLNKNRIESGENPLLPRLYTSYSA